ncbi:MAG: hypothetical protein HYX92_08030 [Chloroflexi bacterium]|nr:hypothetical protein [Chloroflexota bacterium]
MLDTTRRLSVRTIVLASVILMASLPSQGASVLARTIGPDHGSPATDPQASPSPPAIVSPPPAGKSVNADTFAITGTAQAGMLVKVYNAASAVVGSAVANATGAFSVTVPLTQNAGNIFSASATDAGGAESVRITVPTITEDSVAPVISGVTLASVSPTGATITWSTNEPTNSTVRYGAATVPASTLTDPALKTAHSVALTGLPPSTEAFYMLTSCDAAGNCDATLHASFTTAAAPPTPTPAAGAPTPVTPVLRIKLVRGWNLMSVPRRLAEDKVGDVMSGVADRVYTYNATGGWDFATSVGGVWTGTLTSIEDGKAYWVNSLVDGDLTLTLAPKDPSRPAPRYSLPAGWNLIGYTTLDLAPSVNVSAYLAPLAEKWVSLYRYDPNTGYEIARPAGGGFGTVEIGRGYIINLSEQGDLVP